MNTPRYTITATLVVIAALVGGLAAAAWAAGQPERYSATTTVALFWQDCSMVRCLLQSHNHRLPTPRTRSLSVGERCTSLR